MYSDLLLKLLKFNTQNFDDKPSGYTLGLLKYVKERLERNGIRCILQKYKIPVIVNNQKVYLGDRANLIAKIRGQGKSFVALQGHVDTVPSAQGNNGIKFLNNRQGGSISGRGAVDMKGSVASMIITFEKLAKEKKLGPSLLLLLTSDEEANGFAGIKKFLGENKEKIILAICGEPTNFEIQTSFRGILKYSLEKKGKEGHSAFPDRNQLIEGMIPVVNSIETFLKECRRIEDKDFGRTIGAFTTINSGMKENQLPSSFAANWNLRTVKPRKVYDKIFKRTVIPKMPKSAEIKSLGFEPTKSNLGGGLKRAIKKSFVESGISYRQSTTSFFTEANIMNKEGIPAIVFGPGDPKSAHVDSGKEIIAVGDMEKYSELIEKTIRNIGA